jgi:ribosome-associated protein YbcJ (S4-like RNA binding protein)
MMRSKDTKPYGSIRNDNPLCRFKHLPRLGLAIFLATVCTASILDAKSKSASKGIKIDGGTETRENLAVYSDIQGECAISVSNSGSLTLSDSTISKIGDDSRMGSDGAPGEGPGGMTSGEMPEGMQQGDPGGMPGGEMPGGMQGGAPGEMPSGEMPEGMQQGGPGGMPSGDMPEGMQGGGPGGMPGGMQQGQPGPGAQNSGVYAESEGSIVLSDVTITTKLGEGKGLYASGAGSKISLVNGEISTNGNTAHGTYITYGGAIALENTTITTEGAHSSVLATDKGGASSPPRAAVSGQTVTFPPASTPQVW